MNIKDAKVGMRVYENEFGKKGTIAYIDHECHQGCDVEFDDGEYTWIEFDAIDELKEEKK